jgi:hypothetical protein
MKLGALRGTPDSRVSRTASFDLKPRIFGNSLVVVPLGAPSMCLGLPCKVINQSIIGLSLLSETTLSIGHDIP